MNGILKNYGKKTLGVLTGLMLTLMLITVAPMAAHATEDSLRLTVEQVFTNSGASVENTFTYMLKPLEAGNPLPGGGTAAGYTFNISGNSSVELYPLDYSRPDIYRYEIFQVIGVEKPGYTYDKRVYTVEAHVDATLNVIFLVLNKDGTKAMDIRFENKYNALREEPDPPEEVLPGPILPSDPNLMVDPPVVKTVFGEPAVKSTFVFKLKAQKPTNPMPTGSAGGAKIIQIMGSGKGEFGVWSYDQEGVYYYTVSELNTGEKGYTYDTAVYTITDRVTLEKEQLMVSRVVTNALNKRVSTLTFINKYDAAGNTADDGSADDTRADDNADSEIANSKTVNNTGPQSDDPLNSIFIYGTPGGNWIGGMPKTGDDSNITLYLILLGLGGALAFGATAYLIADRKRRKGWLT